MANFFKKYPKIVYGGKIVTDIIARTVIRQQYNDKLTVYYPYHLQDGDTPEIIAHKYYGDVEKHWLVLLANETMDAFFDFSLSYSQFESYITNKYSLEANSINIWKNDSANNWKGEWASNTAYSQNNIVSFVNTAYVCANSHTASTQFSVDYNSSYWQKIYDGNNWKGVWSDSIHYKEQEVVSYNSNIYICKQDMDDPNVNISIGNADYWKTYSNPIEYSQVTLNKFPSGYIAIITTTDVSSGEDTVEKIFIDKKSYKANTQSNNFGYGNAIFDYSDYSTTPKGGSEDPEDNDVIYSQTKELVHIYDYEQELNENKRIIKLIRKEYAKQIEKELKYLMEQQYG